MSLLNRLLFSVTLAIATILMGTLGWSVTSARQYLDSQLQSEGDNAVSALALSLSQPANQDPVTRDLLMMALFDTGKFSAITLTGLDGKSLFERRQTPQSRYRGQAPGWFVALLPLRAPQAQRAISDGWKQVGQLSLTVDNGYAYDALWRSSTRISLLVIVAGLAWAIFVAVLLRWFRRVLHQQVEDQVMAIAGQASRSAHAESGHSEPARVSELAAVVSAIQATRERVRATAREQSDQIESLQLELHTDPVTGLPNRRYFINELRRVLEAESDEEMATGHLMLFRQRDLLAVNAQLNHAQTDAWLARMARQVSNILTQSSPTTPGSQFARLNGSDFIVLLPQLAGPEALVLVETIRQALESLRIPLPHGERCRWAYALTDYLPGGSVGSTLARLDQALMRAESAGSDEVEYAPLQSENHVNDHQAQRQWQHLLHSALTTPGALSLQLRAFASRATGPVLHHEATLMAHPDAKTTLAGTLFLPVALRLGLSAGFDLKAIELALDWLRQNTHETLVIRISLASIQSASFLPQVKTTLQSAPEGIAARLVFEFDAYALQAETEEVTEFAPEVARYGAEVALRRLDQSPMALNQLHQVKLRFVKLGGDFVERASTSPGTRQLLIAMLETARHLALATLVAGTVTPETATWLRTHGAELLVERT
ncbi:bifunctional diguanylate cyclase/phosphodiesterase [Comamonas flocculans]|uniref:EAL domain-containing protein n=1 Tax=Comamonas flocculans TaxID=2597701 RepID=A0A5B8RS38_9BURK|nr:LapD/MoxY N-terminal periplasmic domain-containing protein [Comamonas flocculans]QEA12469.1 EAL domain-containing protein [Comamonas flocculans]